MPKQSAPQELAAIAPKLVEVTNEVLFGDVWQPPGPSPRDRSLVTVSALAVAVFGTLMGSQENMNTDLHTGLLLTAVLRQPLRSPRHPAPRRPTGRPHRTRRRQRRRLRRPRLRRPGAATRRRRLRIRVRTSPALPLEGPHPRHAGDPGGGAETFGVSLAVGDVTGDGVDDIVAGATDTKAGRTPRSAWPSASVSSSTGQPFARRAAGEGNYVTLSPSDVGNCMTRHIRQPGRSARNPRRRGHQPGHATTEQGHSGRNAPHRRGPPVRHGRGTVQKNLNFR
jgi:hypothetical protein